MDSATAAHCRKRQDHFTESLLNDRPLMPADGGWTFGDLVFLKALVDVMIEDAGRSEMGLPLRELTMRLAAERGQEPN
jgi:hypothetical protein